MKEVYDVVILGSGPAGLTAALYSARYARKCCVITESLSGTACKAGTIENWPGEKKISGIDLMKKFKEHVDSYKVKFIERLAIGIKKEKNLFVVDVGENERIFGKTMIIALGTKHRTLNIPGENKFIGKGVSHCATCDGMFFRGKDVVVIGGSDSAAKAAIFLGEIANSVKILYRKQALRCEGIYCERIGKNKKIETIYEAIPLEILGKNKVEGIKVSINKKEQKIKCDGVFIEIGADPISDIAKNLGVKFDSKEHIITDKATKTNVEGVYAAGDMTDTPLQQVVTAASEGAKAAHSAHEFLSRQKD